MGKVSKNSRTDRGLAGGGKDHVKLVISEKNEKGGYVFKEIMVHKDKVDEVLKAQSQG